VLNLRPRVLKLRPRVLKLRPRVRAATPPRFVVMLGDLFQLPPTHGTSLGSLLARHAAPGDFGEVKRLRLERDLAAHGHDNASTHALRVFTAARRLELKRNMRAEGDPDFVRMLERTRRTTKHLEEQDIKKLLAKGQVLKKKERNRWKDATIGVLGNAERYALTAVKAQAYAKQHGKVLIKWRAPITCEYRRSLAGRRGQDGLDGLYTAEPGLWSCFIEGAPGFVIANVNQPKRIANGSVCRMESLIYGGTGDVPDVVSQALEKGGFHEVEIEVPAALCVSMDRTWVGFKDEDTLEPGRVAGVALCPSATVPERRGLVALSLMRWGSR
jgi:hypothetical protein